MSERLSRYFTTAFFSLIDTKFSGFLLGEKAFSAPLGATAARPVKVISEL